MTSLISTGKVVHEPEAQVESIKYNLFSSFPGECDQLLSRGGRLGALVGGAHQLPGSHQLALSFSGGFDHDEPPPQIYHDCQLFSTLCGRINFQTSKSTTIANCPYLHK